MHENRPVRRLFLSAHKLGIQLFHGHWSVAPRALPAGARLGTKSTNQPTNQSTNQSINQSINQRFNISRMMTHSIVISPTSSNLRTTNTHSFAIISSSSLSGLQAPSEVKPAAAARLSWLRRRWHPSPMGTLRSLRRGRPRLSDSRRKCVCLLYIHSYIGGIPTIK